MMRLQSFLWAGLLAVGCFSGVFAIAIGRADDPAAKDGAKKDDDGPVR